MVTRWRRKRQRRAREGGAAGRCSDAGRSSRVSSRRVQLREVALCVAVVPELFLKYGVDALL